MATEIERKFLVHGKPWGDRTGVRFSQGYLNREPERTVRVRIAGEKAFLTIKGATHGATRAEFEYEIPVPDAEKLLAITDGPIIQKIRHVISHDGFDWEVDEFLGENAGLVVAELELSSEDQTFTRPPWLGREVTDDRRYYNSSLVNHPFTTWSERG